MSRGRNHRQRTALYRHGHGFTVPQEAQLYRGTFLALNHGFHLSQGDACHRSTVYLYENISCLHARFLRRAAGRNIGDLIANEVAVVIVLGGNGDANAHIGVADIVQIALVVLRRNIIAPAISQSGDNARRHGIVHLGHIHIVSDKILVHQVHHFLVFFHARFYTLGLRLRRGSFPDLRHIDG